MRILFIGDIFAKSGRKIIQDRLPGLINKNKPDFIIANIENIAHGAGISKKTFNFIKSFPINVFTSGNHILSKPDGNILLKKNPELLRPINVKGISGRGYGIFESNNGIKVGVINIQGRIYMPKTDCPFRMVDKVIEEIKKETNIIFVDFHAEATSEKRAMGYFLDGRVSALIGTHTHIQTADEEILPQGTAYLTDVGMTGPQDSVIGVKKDIIIKRFLSCLPVKFDPSKSGNMICGVIIDIDEKTGKAINIFRIRDKNET